MSLINKPTDLRAFEFSSEIDKGLLRILADDFKNCMLLGLPPFVKALIDGSVKHRTMVVTETELETGESADYVKVICIVGPLGDKTLCRLEIAGVDNNDQLWLRVNGVYESAAKLVEDTRERAEEAAREMKAESVGGIGDLLKNLLRGGDNPLPGDEWKNGGSKD